MLLLRKGVYQYEYMDDWSRFDEEGLSDKIDFYSSLNIEKISDIDYRHARKAFDKLQIKNLGEYYDLHVQSDTLLLGDVFENLRDVCIKVYGLDPVYFLSAPGLAWKACLKKIGVKLELLRDIDMLLMIEKRIRGGIFHFVYRHAKVNNKYMEGYDKNKKSSYIIYEDANSLYAYAMCQKLPVNSFEWIEDLSIIGTDFIKNYDEESNVGYFIEADIKYPKHLQVMHSDLPFLPERMSINGYEKLVCNLYDEKYYVDHIRSL